MDNQALTDRRVVTAQLGRAARGQWDVAHRCPYGYPQVIRVHPVVAGHPFPTLYWLTCPFLKREVSRLEADGWVKRLEARMAASPELSASMSEAHERYRRERNALLSDVRIDAAVAESLKHGIGGISDRRYLKCLHLHVAHALVGENSIGAIVLDLVSDSACSRKEVICSAYV